MLAVYLYDRPAARTDDFMKLTEKFIETFDSKPRDFSPLLFTLMINEHPREYVSK